jgi:ketosteroid isomerase-like protein
LHGTLDRGFLGRAIGHLNAQGLQNARLRWVVDVLVRHGLVAPFAPLTACESHQCLEGACVHASIMRASRGPGNQRSSRPKIVSLTLQVGSTEEVIQRSYDAWRRGDIESAVAFWSNSGELCPLPGSRVYNGPEGVRLFLERDIHEREEFDIRIYTILEQADYALVFGRYSIEEAGKVVEKGMFWIARVEADQIVRIEAFANVGEAMATFKERLGLVWS